MRGAASLAFAALVVAAPAAAQKSDSCARFDAPLAYNACLAAHGPRAARTGARPASPDEEASGRVRRAPHGRQRLEFNVRD
jgi:hypothetical protein